LFGVYLNDLSTNLSKSNLGARISNCVTNHLIYADDVCLITTTLSAMNSLLKICDTYAASHNLNFNPSKTEFQAFTPNFMFKLKDHISVIFNNVILKNNIQVKYLGYTIANRLRYQSIIDDTIEFQNRISD